MTYRNVVVAIAAPRIVIRLIFMITETVIVLPEPVQTITRTVMIEKGM